MSKGRNNGLCDETDSKINMTLLRPTYLPRNARTRFKGTINTVQSNMCVFSHRLFHPSTASSTTTIRAESSKFIEIQLLWSRSFATESEHRMVTAVVDNAMSGHRTIIDTDSILRYGSFS